MNLLDYKYKLIGRVYRGEGPGDGGGGGTDTGTSSTGTGTADINANLGTDLADAQAIADAGGLDAALAQLEAAAAEAQTGTTTNYTDIGSFSPVASVTPETAPVETSPLATTDVGSFGPVASVNTSPTTTETSTAKPGETTIAQTASQTGGTDLSTAALAGTLDAATLSKTDLAALQAMGFGSLEGANKNNPTQTIDQLYNSYALNDFLTENLSAATIASMVAGPIAGLLVDVATSIAQGKSPTSVLGNVVGSILGQAISQTTGVPVSLSTLTALVDGQVGRAGLSVAFNAVAQQTGLSSKSVEQALTGNLGAAVQNTVVGALTSEAAKTLGADQQFMGQVLGATGLSSAIGTNIAGFVNQVAAPINEVTAQISNSISSIGVPTGVNNLSGAISSGQVNTTPVGAEGGNQEEYLKQVALNSGISPAQAQTNISTPPKSSGGISINWGGVQNEVFQANNKLPVVPVATGTSGTTGAMQGGFGSGTTAETTTGSGTTDAMQGGFGSATGVTPITGGAADASTGTDVIQNLIKAGLDETDPWGDLQGAIDSAAVRGINAKSPTFSEAFSSWKTALGPGKEFPWTNPATGETRLYTTNLAPTESERLAQSIADQKRIDLMPVYGGAQNTRTGTPINSEYVYINTDTGDVVVDTRVFDSLGQVVSGSLNLADEKTTTAALNTAVGSAVRTGLDILSGIPKGAGSLAEQVGTLAGLTGLADMDNVLTRTGTSAKAAVDAMRSTDFKDKAALMNAAIQKAGNEGFFAELIETGKQFGANPVQMAEFIVQQSPSLLVGGGGMAVAKSLGAGMTAAEAAAIGVNAATQGASVAKEAYDDAIKNGKSPEQALQASRLAGSLAAFTSVASNKFIPGALSTEGMIAAQTAAKTSIRNALVGEMSSEVAEETSGQIIKNWVNGDSWDKGLGSTVAMSLIGSGMTTGIVHGVYNSLDQNLTQDQKNAAVDKIIDQGIVTKDEARQIAVDLGYANPSQAIIDSIVGPVNEFDARAELNTFFKSLSAFETGKPVSAADAQEMMKDLGLTGMSDQEAVSLASKIVSSAPKDFLMTPAVTEQDVTKIVDDALKANPSLTQAQVTQIVKDAVAATPTGTTPGQVQSIVDTAIKAIPSGLTTADVSKIVGDAFKANPYVSQEQVASLISDAVGKIPPGMTAVDVGKIVNSAIANIPAGLSTADVAKVVNNAISQIPAGLSAADVGKIVGDAVKAIPVGLSRTDVDTIVKDALAANPSLTQDQVAKIVSDQIAKIPAGITAAQVKSQVDSAIGAPASGTTAATGVYAAIKSTSDALSKAIADNEKAGLTRDQAMQKALTDVSAQMGVNKTELLNKIGATEATLSQKLATGLQGVTSKIAATEQSLLTAIQAAKDIGLQGDAALQAGINSVAANLGLTKTALLSQLGTTEANLKSQFATQISGLDTKLTAAIADAKASGLAGDAALKAAIDKVAAAQGTSAANLLSQIGTTEANLKSQFATQISGLDTKLTAAIADAKASGLAGDAALKAAIDKVAADQGVTAASLLSKIGTTEANLKSQFASQISGVQTQIAGVQASLQQAIQAAKDIGLQGDAALQTGIDSVAANLGVTKAALLTQLGTTEANLKAQFSTQLGAVQQSVTALGKTLSDTIAANEKAGLTRDQATQKALTDVAAQMGVNKTELLNRIGATEATLNQKLAAGLQDVTTKIAATEQSLAAAIQAAKDIGLQGDAALQAGINSVAANLGLTKTALLTQLGTTEANLKTQFATQLGAVQQSVATLQKTLSDTIAANEKAGLTRDQATQKALADVSAQMGTDKATLLNTIGATEANLNQKLAAGLQDVTGKITATEKALSDAIQAAKDIGLKGDAALQAGIDSVAANLGVTKAAFLSELGTTEANLKAQFATQLGAVQQSVTELEQTLTSAIAANEKAGLTRDQATQKALADVSAQMGTDKATLLNTIGATEATLNQKLASVAQSLESQLTAQGKQFRDALVAQGLSQQQALETAIAAQNEAIKTGQSETQAAINSLSEAQQKEVADRIAAGQETNAAIAAVKAEVASGQTALSNQLTEQGKQFMEALMQQGMDQQTALKTAIDAQNQLITSGQTATQTALSELSAAQQKEVADRIAAGQETNAAIAAVKAEVTAGQTALSSQLTAQGKQFMDALVAQGMSQQQALETAVAAQNEQARANQEATQQQIGGVQTQLNERIDQLTKTGMDQFTATQTALREMNTSLTGQLSAAEAQRQADMAAAAAQRQADQEAAAASAAAAEKQRQADIEAQKAREAANLRTTQVGQLRGQMMTGLQGLMGGLQQQATQMAAPGQVETVKATPGFDFSSPLNVGFFSGYESQKVPPKGQESTKIAEGGYLDDLLDAIR